MKANSIAPKMLHKSSLDDVLVNSPRRAFPAKIRLGALSYYFASDLYRQGEGEYLDLKLPVESMERSGFAGALAGKLPHNMQWSGSRGVPFQLMNQIASYCEKNMAELGNWIEAQPSAVAKTFSTSLEFINDANHYFFYRKQHDHVPGTMLIEAARQAVYFHLYDMNEALQGNITVSLNELHSYFYRYVDLMYPVELVVDEILGVCESPRMKFYRVSIYQEALLAGVVDTKATLINLKSLKTIRNVFLRPTGSFVPIRSGSLTSSIITAEGNRHSLEVVSITAVNCVTRGAFRGGGDTHRILIEDACGQLFMARVENPDIRGNVTNWRYVDVSPEDLLDLSEIIKRCCVQDTAVEAVGSGSREI